MTEQSTVSTNTLTFKPKGDTWYRHIPTNMLYLLRQRSDCNFNKTQYLWSKDNLQTYENIVPSEWEEYNPHNEAHIVDVQAALIELLEHLHDGDRLEIL